MENLIFSLNATMPLFLMMVLGYVLKRVGIIDFKSANVINKLVFRIFLPCLLFTDLYKQDFSSMWDGQFVGFCAISTVVSILIAFLLAKVFCESSDQGEFIQASYRSAAATLGIAFMTNIYDNVAMVALMIIGSVPIYNVVAVIVLSLTAPNGANGKGKELFKRTLKNLVTNPIILGIVLGMIWSVFKLPLPSILNKSVTYLGNCASPLALIGLGACFEFSDVKEKLKSIICVNFNKLFLFCIIFLPVAIHIGYRDDKLVAALIMLGSATTSSSFIMSKNMGHQGNLSSSSVMTTTLLSSFTLTFWLFILRMLGLI